MASFPSASQTTSSADRLNWRACHAASSPPHSFSGISSSSGSRDDDGGRVLPCHFLDTSTAADVPSLYRGRLYGSKVSLIVTADHPENASPPGACRDTAFNPCTAVRLQGAVRNSTYPARRPLMLQHDGAMASAPLASPDQGGGRTGDEVIAACSRLPALDPEMLPPATAAAVPATARTITIADCVHSDNPSEPPCRATSGEK
jgi:hypothetical protein